MGARAYHCCTDLRLLDLCGSNAGGGGERVLWVAIKALERLCTPSCGIHVVIYTGDGDAKPTEILAKAKVGRDCSLAFACQG